MARQDLLRYMFVTLDTTHLLMSPLNEEARPKAVVFGRKKKEERVRFEMDQIKTTKDHHYQQLARQDLLLPNDVTLDTSHWLISALNAVAPVKAVVFGRRKKKCKTG